MKEEGREGGRELIVNISGGSGMILIMRGKRLCSGFVIVSSFSVGSCSLFPFRYETNELSDDQLSEALSRLGQWSWSSEEVSAYTSQDCTARYRVHWQPP